MTTPPICTSMALLSLTTVAAVVTAIGISWRRQQATACIKIRADKSISLELNELENVLFATGEQPISTLTWFRGDFRKAKLVLERRIGLILEHNPWLTGRVCKRRRGKLVLEYDKTRSKCKLQDYFVVLDPVISPIDRRMPPGDLCRICTRNLIFRNGSQEPLFRVSIVPCHTSPDTTFALVVSLSHLVGDGATFYRLHHMICCTEDSVIVPLIAERIKTSSKQQMEAMGAEEHGYLTSYGVLTGLAMGMVRVKTFGSPPPEQRFALVDNAAMKRSKADAATHDGLPFVSTNDVLTSWFLQDTGCTHGVMNVNFRNRLNGHGNLHAGNYENALFYRRDDSATPGLIRKSLSNLRRVSSNVVPMPGFWECATSSIAMVTNWTPFAQANVIQGCQEEVHVPLYDIASSTPFSFALLIIFRSGPQRIGLFYSGQPGLLKDLHSAPFLSDEEIMGMA